MADVQDIPRYPNGQAVAITWAEGGTATEPLAGRKVTGWQPADVVTEAELNWLSREPMRVIRALYSRFPNASEQFFGSWFPPLDCGIWQDAVNPLDVYLTDSGLVNSVVADVWVDPPSVDTGAVRVQVSVPLASPQTLVANRTTYVYVPNTMIAPPVVTTAEVIFLDVPLNDPPPAEPAGTTLVWFIDTDGTGIVDQGILLPPFPFLKTIGVDSINANDIETTDLNVAGNLTVDGNTVLGDAITDATTMAGPAYVGDYLFAYDDIITGGDLVANYGSLFVGVDASIGGVLLSQVGIESNGYLDVWLDGSIDGNVDLCTGVGAKTLTIGTDSSDVITSAATATFSSSVNLCTGVGTFALVIGSSSLDTMTVNSTVNAPLAIAASSGSAMLTVTNAGGPGMTVAVASGYAATFSGDASSPVKAALFIAPQDADPSSPVHGDFFQNYNRAAGKMRFRSLVAYESLHSSPKGRVFEATEGADFPALVGSTGNICATTILPEETGNVLVTGSFYWDPDADTDTVTFILRDNTAATNILTKVIRAKDIDGAGTRGETVVLRKVYTLPSAASRTFSQNIQTSSAGDVEATVLSVEGVF